MNGRRRDKRRAKFGVAWLLRFGLQPLIHRIQVFQQRLIEWIEQTVSAIAQAHLKYTTTPVLAIDHEDHRDADNHCERSEWDEYRHALRNGLS